jgi:hypothetical protein
VHYCGINFADILMAMGMYQEKPPLPAVFGNISQSHPWINSHRLNHCPFSCKTFINMCQECLIIYIEVHVD